jgi:ribosomal protein L19E
MIGVGSNRMSFEPYKLDDIADAITREDMEKIMKN